MEKISNYGQLIRQIKQESTRGVENARRAEELSNAQASAGQTRELANSGTSEETEQPRSVRGSGKGRLLDIIA